MLKAVRCCASRGRGSAIDAAKAVATLATNKGKIQDYEGIDLIDKPLPR